MQNKLILVLNCGSSSIKFSVINPHSEKNYLYGIVDKINDNATLNLTIEDKNSVRQLNNIDYATALQLVFSEIDNHLSLANAISAVGHRVVHGGEYFQHSEIINNDVIAGIRTCIPLAPLHNPANLLGIEMAQKILRDKPQVAVFDTAFHQTMPPHSYIYALPYSLYEKHAIRRYGFHGTSHRYVTQHAATLLQQPLDELALISAHLGNGCSVAAVLNGKSIDTSMGLTPLEGLVMGTRSGDIDPAIPLYLINELNYSATSVDALFNKQSGLLGISCLSNDMRSLTEAAQAKDEKAQLAIEIFCYRLAKYIASYVVPLGQLDALIFTGGIGENSALVRYKTLQWLKMLNFHLNDNHNESHGVKNHSIITEKNSTIAMVIRTNEEALIAQDTYHLTINSRNQHD